MSEKVKKIARRMQSCVRVYSKSKRHNAVLWRQIDKFLEDMCKKFPDHSNLNEVILKVTAIDRLYRAMLYRRRRNYRKIALGLMDSNIDDVLKHINGSLNLKNLPKVLEAAGIVAGFGNPKRPRYWVFASKYLHFHKPRLFPLFDSNAKKKCNSIANRLGLRNQSKVNKNPYEAFCRQLLALQGILTRESGYKPSLSDFDKFLYGEEYLKGS
jgi:hypothetical protein